jgi:L-2,4-diaminobutyrate decarboxylase
VTIFGDHREMFDLVAGALDDGASLRGDQPLMSGGPDALEELLPDLLPADGRSLRQVMKTFAPNVVAGSIDLGHPFACAHLQAHPCNPAVAGATLAAVLNPSLDSWDQAPIATHVEMRLVRAICRLAGYTDGDGTFTSGGTQSNLMGLLLAREQAAADCGAAAGGGLPPGATTFRVLCSELAHFSISQAAMVLGLGANAVVPVPVDSEQRMRMDALDRELDQLRASGLRPIVVVATAGTTDFGSIDPLPEIALRCRREGMWFHIDAAYGAGLLFSDRHRSLLQGLEQADSIALDFHKLGWQPAPCSLLCVREAKALRPVESRAPYLNADDDEDAGFPNLVARSLQTTRGFDALKLALTLRVTGRAHLGAMVDAVVDLAQEAAAAIETQPRLQLAVRPALSTVIFRYVPEDLATADQVNAAIRRTLLTKGRAIVGRTSYRSRVWLKFTLLNPATTPQHMRELATLVADTGANLEEASSS